MPSSDELEMSKNTSQPDVTNDVIQLLIEALRNKANKDQIKTILSKAGFDDLDSDGNDMPRSLIVTNLDSRCFNQDSPERIQFESLFREVDSEATFFYFKSFRRARVDVSNASDARTARIVCNQRQIGNESINCYFSDVTNNNNQGSNATLLPPALEKQFLISPPASPPEGWQPCEEAQPVMNFDLQTALASLLPGSAHELHAATDDQPGIVVHVAESETTTTTIKKSDSIDIPDLVFDSFSNVSKKIPQTARPPSMRVGN